MAEVRTAEAKPKVEKKKLTGVEIEIGKKGGHIVKHRYTGGDPMVFGGGEEQHIFGKEDGEKLLAHLKKHLKIKGAEEDEKLEDEDDGPSKGNEEHKKRENASTETDEDEGGKEIKKEEDE